MTPLLRLVLVVLGIVLSPLRATAATSRMLIAYDVAVLPTAATLFEPGRSLRSEWGGAPAYVYDDAHATYDDGLTPSVVGSAGTDHAYDCTLKLAAQREVSGGGAVYGATFATVAAEATGTVWDAVKATQPVWEGTAIPRSFELATDSGSVWVHGNATEHLAEYATSMLGRGVTPDLVNVATQVQIGSRQGAVNSALQGGVTYGQMMNAGGWELMFGAPRAAGQLPALIHAMPF